VTELTRNCCLFTPVAGSLVLYVQPSSSDAIMIARRLAEEKKEQERLFQHSAAVGARASAFLPVVIDYDRNRRETTMDKVTALALYENEQKRPSAWNWWPIDH
jgi:hypothetical protein